MKLEELLLPSIQGIEFDFEESEVTLGTTAVEIVKHNAKRHYLLVMNISDTACKVSTKEGVTTSSGFPLAQNTGNFEYEFPKHGKFSTLQWWGISSGASKKLSVLEGFARKIEGGNN